MKKILKTIKKWVSLIWKIIVVIGVVLGIWVGYAQIFKQPSIFSQIINEINVLDINKPLKDLQILFQEDNIQEKKLNLKIYRVKIKNNGGTNITQNEFDENDNWGIRIEKGRIIETRLVDHNSEYINENLSPQIENNNLVKFNKIIFDRGNFFIIELLVLHDKNTPPVLYQIGKIAGIQESESKILAIDYSESFWSAFFYGNWLINIVRFIVYGLALVAIIVAIFFLVFKWREKRQKAAQRPQPPQKPN